MTYNIMPFLSQTPCFTREELAAFLKRALRTQQVATPTESVLKRLHRPGGECDHKVPVQQRSGIYVTRTALGTPEVPQWLPYLLVMKAGETTIISHQAALWLHLGLPAPSILRYYDLEDAWAKPWEWGQYRFWANAPNQPQVASSKNNHPSWCLMPIAIGGRSIPIRVTTLEQTLVDILRSRARRNRDLAPKVGATTADAEGSEAPEAKTEGRNALEPEFLECWARLSASNLRLDFRALRAYLQELGCRATTSKVAYYLSGTHERHGIPLDYLWELKPRLRHPRAWREGLAGALVLPWLLRVPEDLKHEPRARLRDGDHPRIEGGLPIESLNLLAYLRELYGKPKVKFRLGQEELILKILKGQDAMGIIPTGAGKSLCYQLPATLLNGLTLVISPLLALMNEQVEKARAMGISAMAYSGSSGGHSRNPGVHEEITTTREQVLMGIQQGTLKLLFVSPESLTTLVRAFEDLKAAVVQLVVDEAHTILSWGQDFRQALRGLRRLRVIWPHVPILALTATASRSERLRLMAELSFRADTEPYVGSTYRPGLYLQVEKVASGFDAKLAALVTFIQGQEIHRGKRLCGIVYCRSKNDTQKVAEALDALFEDLDETQQDLKSLEEDFLDKFHDVGWQLQPDPSDKTFCLPFGSRVQCYHAGLSMRNRAQAEYLFRRGKARIMVATVAFGMGIDKGDVRYVAHCGPPTTVGDYVQEVGRAGRDGSEAECILLHSDQDWVVWKKRLQAEIDSLPCKRHKNQRPRSPEQKRAHTRNLKRRLDALRKLEALLHSPCLHQGIAKHYDEDIPLCEQHCYKCQPVGPHRAAWWANQAAGAEPQNEAIPLAQDDEWVPIPDFELLDEFASEPAYDLDLSNQEPDWSAPDGVPDPEDRFPLDDPIEAFEASL